MAQTLFGFPAGTPERRLGLGAIDLVFGFGFVALLFVDKTLLDFGGRWIDWPENVAAALRSIASLGLLAGTVFFCAKALAAASAERSGLVEAGLIPRRPVNDLIYTLLGTPAGIVLTLATLTGVNWVATWAGVPAPPVNHGILQQMQETDDRARLTGLVIAVVVMGPLLEEIVFRGLLQTCLLKLLGPARRWSVVLIASTIFACVHLGATTWHALPGLLVLGVVLGWMYERTGSLWPAILAHAVFNGFNVWVVLNHPHGAG